MLGAIEAGGTKMVVAVARDAEAILARRELPTTTPAETFAAIADFLVEHAPFDAIGVASFGPVEVNPVAPNYGSILKTPKPNWSGASFIDVLKRFNCPVAVDSDVNGAALAEWRAARGAGVDNLAYATIGTGIGVGVVRGGRTLAGMHHFEMGHIRPSRDAASDPFEGVCPFHGACLEGLASGPAVIKRWGKPLSELGPDAVVLIARYLGEMCLTIILTHMPDRIVLGGGVMKTGGLIEAVRAETRALLNGYIGAARLSGDLADYIVRPALGENAGVTGALLLAADAAK
ncbi:MAG TPA: fructokinase [Parvularcula sp.]|nr:fructokinase [Parvularcula sp.]HBS34714.1 fructokinase [Parvularcula sp.]